LNGRFTLHFVPTDEWVIRLRNYLSLYLVSGEVLNSTHSLTWTNWPYKNVFSDCLKRLYDISGSLRYVRKTVPGSRFSWNGRWTV